MSPSDAIETVRGALPGAAAEDLVRVWTGRGLLEEAEARARLPEVVCVLRNGEGEVAGVNSVFPGRVELIGNQRLWIYRSLLLPGAEAAGSAMLSRAFAALDAEFAAAPDGPIGLVVLVTDPAVMTRFPEARWEDPPLIYAGYLPDGAQVRVGYFAGARIVDG